MGLFSKKFDQMQTEEQRYFAGTGQSGQTSRPARSGRRSSPSVQTPASPSQRAADEVTQIASATGGRVEKAGRYVQTTLDTRSMGRSEVNRLRRLTRDNRGSFEEGNGYVQITLATN